MRSPSGVLRLAPLTIARPRLNRWLDAYAGYPARILIAPAGSGKTSLLSKYSQAAHRPSVYCALDEDCTLARMREIIATALGSSAVPQSYEALVRLLNKNGHMRDVIVDNADNGTPDVSAELLQLLDDPSVEVSLVYAARSRERLDIRRAVARGVAVLCDAKHLAFDVADVRALCEAFEIDAQELQLQRLVDDTDGWALAAAGAVRVAAAERATLARGYEMWREANETFLRDFVDVELRRVAAPERDLFWRLFAGGDAGGGSRLRDLEFQGLHVLDQGRGSMRLYRPLLPVGIKASTPAQEDAFVQPMFVKMFRQFEARIGNTEIPWVRRRDQQIVKYLLLKPDGRATRGELASIFWGDTDRHLATQSVRTACSTIRRAFAAVVGPANVERYFRTVPDVQIDLNHVVCDVRRFVEHVDQGDSAFATDDPQSFLPHYRAAEKLYRGDLLEFEAPETWFAQESRLLRERFGAVMERLSPDRAHEAVATA